MDKISKNIGRFVLSSGLDSSQMTRSGKNINTTFRDLNIEDILKLAPRAPLSLHLSHREQSNKGPVARTTVDTNEQRNSRPFVSHIVVNKALCGISMHLGR